MANAKQAKPKIEKPVEDKVVSYELRGKIAILTLAYRPHNLIGPQLLGGISAGLNEAERDKARTIIIRSGIRHFSAGADIELFTSRVSGGDAKDSSDKPSGSGDLNSVVNFLARMELLPIPIIASVHGVCLGGGLELALACDYIVAASSAKFGSVEATLGLNPLMGGTQRQVQRIGSARAKEMSMLARRYDADTMERWGLINLAVADDTLEVVTMTLAEEFANGPTVAFGATKKLAYIAANDGVLAADKAMADLQAPIWASEDLKIGLSSFMRNGPGLARFKGE